MNTTDQVRDHYKDQDGGADLVERVTRTLAGMDGPLTPARLAGFDQFHVRGLAATAELGAMLGIDAGSMVLDAGSGLGGPSRFMAETYDCTVTGVDLTPSYVAVSTLLAERTGLARRVTYEVGDLLALPLPDARFDVAFTQHVVMNIKNRDRVYGEIRRVLKAGGRFGFYDVLASDATIPPLYPVPWAETDATSTLLTEADTRSALERAGLTPTRWTDVTTEAVDWFRTSPPASAPGPNLGLVMGPRFAAMTANFMRNLAEGRLRLVMGTCVAGAA